MSASLGGGEDRVMPAQTLRYIALRCEATAAATARCQGGRRPVGSRGRGGEKRKGRPQAWQAAFSLTRQAACHACPLIRTNGDVMGQKRPDTGLTTGCLCAHWKSDRHRDRRRRPKGRLRAFGIERAPLAASG